MISADNLKLLDEWVAAVNAHDVDRYTNLFTPDGTWEIAGVATPTGAPAIKAFWESVLRALPDIRMSVVDGIADEGRIFAVLEYSGRFTGTLARPGLEPIPATGRAASVKIMIRIETRDGRAATLFQVTNYLDMYRQLGVLP